MVTVLVPHHLLLQLAYLLAKAIDYPLLNERKK